MNPKKIFSKVAGQVRLMRSDPESFASNIRQYTDPAGYEARLLDMVDIPPVTAVVDRGEFKKLNIFMPAIRRDGMTGGPNTVLNVGCHLAMAGVPVRFVATGAPLEANRDWFWSHLSRLVGVTERIPNVSLASAAGTQLSISADDQFMATFWTTAHQIAPLMRLTRHERFIYLIQDFEPGFYAWSSNYAMALASYNLAYQAIVNESTLADYLSANGIGRFSDVGFRDSCTVFEPAIDRQMFHPGAAPNGVVRAPRLLVYARPKLNARNLLGMAVAAVRGAVAAGALKGWEILAIGARGSLPAISIGDGLLLREAPWQDLHGYAQLLRDSDILLCPMLSPHTSYPVLEMAASGGIAITNSFATKTAARLQDLSPSIVAAEPSVAGFTAALIDTATKVATGMRGSGDIRLPETWEKSFAKAVQHLQRRLAT